MAIFTMITNDPTAIFTMITNDPMGFYGDFMVIQWEISREIFTIPVTTSSDHRIMMWDHSQVLRCLEV